MAISHNGKQAPQLPEDMNPGDTDTFYMSWTDKLSGATISSSTWTIPANFTEVSAATNISVTASGTTYENCNSIDRLRRSLCRVLNFLNFFSPCFDQFR